MRLLSVLALCIGLFTFAQACKTDEDCSLNGVCESCDGPTKVCRCDAGWFGDDCGRLDLAPAKRSNGYNYANFTSPNYYSTNGNSSWGAQILQDPEDKKLFHMFTDQFGHGCGLTGWRPHSTIVRAESRTGPQGPFHYAQTVFPAFRHNNYVFWSPSDKKYLMYAIGVDAPEPDHCVAISFTKWPNNISVSSADHIRGPWTPFNMILNSQPPDHPHSTNPSPWPLWTPHNHTSKIILGVEDDAIFAADKFDGVYDLLKVQNWNISDFSPTWTEDPFLWRDKRGNWQFLTHWLIDLVEHNRQQWPRVGAHQFARDIKGPWHFNLHEAFNSTVTYDDGSMQTFKRRERPKLFFSDDGEMTPLYLTTGVQEMNQSSKSYTFIQPIGSRWKTYEKELGFKV